MTTSFKSTIAFCGLSTKEAAEFLSVRPDTINSWSSGRRNVPIGAWRQLAGLFQKMQDIVDLIIEDVEAFDIESPPDPKPYAIKVDGEPLPFESTSTATQALLVLTMLNPE